MKENVLIFLRPFTIMAPTLDEQNAFMIQEIITDVECKDLGKIYDNGELYGKDIPSFIRCEIKANRPKWIIAERECATAALSLYWQKKILINTTETFDNLNNVPDFARKNTYGFLSREFE